MTMDSKELNKLLRDAIEYLDKEIDKRYISLSLYKSRILEQYQLGYSRGYEDCYKDMRTKEIKKKNKN
jgi:hypothetical protein